MNFSSKYRSLYRQIRLVVPLLFLICLSMPPFIRSHVFAANIAGTLDTSFGPGHTGEVFTSFSPSVAIANGVALQSDGKIVAAGLASLSFDATSFALARYNTDGSADTTFGPSHDGTVTTPFGSLRSFANAVAIQSDGKIVAAGFVTLPKEFDFALARYNTNGSLDTTFGPNHDGMVTTSFNVVQATASGLAIQSDGKIVAAGAVFDNASGFAFGLARYNAGGTLDTTFGPNFNGLVTTSFNDPEGDLGGGANSVLVQPDGNIVAAGECTGPASGGSFTTRFALARYNTNGNLDTTFGPNLDGKVITTPDSFGSEIFGVALQSDGKIVAAGSAFDSSFVFSFALARYDDDGSLDTTFGPSHTGKVTTSFGGTLDQAQAVAIQSDGKIIAGGFDENGASTPGALARYNTDGTLDSTFGPNNDGKVTTSFAVGAPSEVFGVAIQVDGKIVTAGRSSIGGFSEFAVVRYNNNNVTGGGPGGSFDTCLKDNTTGNVFAWNSVTGAYSFSICKTGFTLTGTGVVRLVGSTRTLTDSKPDRRISAGFLTGQKTGSAVIYLVLAPGVLRTYTVNDTTSLGAGCACGS